MYKSKKVDFNSISNDDLEFVDNYLLILTYFELKSENKIFFTKDEISKMENLPGCAWWNTLTITGIGRTEGAAREDLYFATIQSANSSGGGSVHGCTSISSVEITNFGSIQNASQSFCCERVFPSMTPP